MPYDAAGNLTNDSLHTFSYDAENRIKAMDSTAATYTYDPGPLRIKKVVGGSTTVYIFSGSKVLAEYGNGALSKEYVYAGSELLTTSAADGTTTYRHPDHLSIRFETDAAGTVTRNFAHYPFGETNENRGISQWQFTSYERDSESGLDYAIFRGYNSRLGRFAEADLLAGSAEDPQSMNRYGYVGNDPINLADPLGLTTECVTTCITYPDGHRECHTTCKESPPEPPPFDSTIGGCDWLGDPMKCISMMVDAPDPIDLKIVPPTPRPPVAPCKAQGTRNHGYPAVDVKTQGNYGRPVYATEDGIVVRGSSGGSPSPYPGPPAMPGTTDYIVLLTVSGNSVKYVHAAPTVPPGFPVSAGQQIGVNTRTGRLSGPHVHMELFNGWGQTNSSTRGDVASYLSLYCTF